ncbi:hypothetical protein ACGFYM_40035 [Streptomyces sp. NPDC048231]|uniref:hypothetical protein n=1 Tax=Streptomyces sp. NPDC048231 TaxID=3365519 RepID=UPI0037111099
MNRTIAVANTARQGPGEGAEQPPGAVGVHHARDESGVAAQAGHDVALGLLGAGTGVRYWFPRRTADHLRVPGRLLVRDQLSDDIHDGLPHPAPKAAGPKGGRGDERGTERGVDLDADRVELGPSRKVGEKDRYVPFGTVRVVSDGLGDVGDVGLFAPAERGGHRDDLPSDPSTDCPAEMVGQPGGESPGDLRRQTGVGHQYDAHGSAGGRLGHVSCHDHTFVCA